MRIAVVGVGHLGKHHARILADIVYQSSGRDPSVLGLAALVLFAAGIGATAEPARRALSVDPLRAIRSD